MFTVRDYAMHGAPSANYGFGDWIGSLITGVASLGMVGASIYTGVLGQKLAAQQYRTERQRYNEQKAQEAAMLLQLQNQQTITQVLPPGDSAGAMTMPFGLSTNKLLIGGAIAGGLLLTILIIKR